MKIQFTLGTSSFTPIMDIDNHNANVLERQLQISVPLITSVKLMKKNNKKEQIKNIYVGKEINLKTISKHNYWLTKYDISIEDVIDICLQGYKRACLLNYKRYDQIVVGVDANDEIVPDYYALKAKIKEWQEK